MNNLALSLCMPTNGVIEWVFPVLDSIFSQGCDSQKFEVVITDNGNNKAFKEKIKIYIQEHSNIQYFETDAMPFLNEIESYKRAQGHLIKFVNHRTILVEGSLERLIHLATKNLSEKPIIYFTNGVLEKGKTKFEYDTFDQFVTTLSYWSSWSTGMTIWRDDFAKLPNDVSNFNELFPHTNVLFAERNRDKYIVDNSIIFEELHQGKKPKGNYNLFYAFGVEYPSIILDLYRSNSITAKTLKKILYDNLAFVANMYLEFYIFKKYCSYDLTGITDMYNIFYTKKELRMAVVKIFMSKCAEKVKRIINK